MSYGIELRDRLAWNRTSSVMALMVNSNLDPKKGKPVAPAEFNPYLQKEAQKQRREKAIEVKDAESRALFKAAMTGIPFKV